MGNNICKDNRPELIQQFAVSSEQMRNIEGRIFAAGMPVPALMEKVAGKIAQRIEAIFQQGCGDFRFSPLGKIGILAGPGHNGGDALVVARELFFKGYQVVVYSLFEKLKELTGQHAGYAASLGIPFSKNLEPLQDCDLLIDGLFGFGLERKLEGPVAETIEEINSWNKPVFSIDLPSGLHTDTGEVLGTAIKASRSFCLGLWKLAFLQDAALEYIGTPELIDFDIPVADIEAVLGSTPPVRRITPTLALSYLPLGRAVSTYKYKQGHLLLVAGSRKYTGAVILSALAARASGVGMLSVAVPESLKPLLSPVLPEALIVGCAETETGAISQLPLSLDLAAYNAIACGPGLTLEAAQVVETVLESDRPLVLDADGLNVLAHLGPVPTLAERQAPSILTPHAGEFKRLFPNFVNYLTKDRICATKMAALESGSVVVLKGARTVVADPGGAVWVNPESTPALARGGSGDVLTGLMGGLMAQTTGGTVQYHAHAAIWWHSQAGILAAEEKTVLGVDAFSLTDYLLPVLGLALRAG